VSETERVVELLGGKKALGTRPRHEKDFIALVRRGVPYPAFAKATKELDVSNRLLEKALRLSSRSLQRRARGRLNLVESERIVRLVQVYARAEHVLGAHDAAIDWLTRPNRALAGDVPLSLLDTEIGAKSVLDVLGRVEYGVYS
jgi:putative toxin-antitoxin system antitoxin component (TIGR02293 family)